MLFPASHAIFTSATPFKATFTQHLTNTNYHKLSRAFHRASRLVSSQQQEHVTTPIPINK